MALHVPKVPNYVSMLKEGTRHFEGLEEAVFRNIEACVAIAKNTRSTYGPGGQNKIVINHIGKQFVTNDAVTILRELEVQHPAAKMLILATQQQEQEAGDGTNIVFRLAGALLDNARDLLKMGLSVAQIIEGYEMASKKALEFLDEIVVKEVKNCRDKSEVAPLIKTSIMSKQIDISQFLSDLIASACISIMPDDGDFNVDNVRVLKVLGSGVDSSSLVKGMVFRRDVEGDVKEVNQSKIAIYSCPLEALQTETKGTVLLHTAEELKQFSEGEENQMEKLLTSIANSGVKVIVSGGKISELALHYANKLGIMLVRLVSKFDVRRLCKSTGATPLPTLTVPTADGLGFIDHVKIDEIADTNVVVFERGGKDGVMVTLVLRGSTDNILDDTERAVDDSVNTYKALTRSNKVVAGAGACEIELARRLLSYADTIPGLEQYAIREFARSFEIIVKALSENAGEKATEIIADLYARHQAGEINAGFVTLPKKDPSICDAVKAEVLDLYNTKRWAIRFASNAACTVLRVDQIIMSRPAGGPKPRDPRAADED
uniref:T-complex protein 1 subunit theta n=1 Tax=Spirometra erinaceieuropaei TaxID=99802 RepID=I6SPH0_SPIER|nr:chaperonin containing tcp1 [Spirometra erinaceieuropaei]